VRKRFCAMILTHGRADRVVTYKTLRLFGYTGDIVLVIDDEDEQADRYRELYGDQVVQFCKSDIASRFDEADNFSDRRTIFYARNAAFEIAEKLGYQYFMQLDDDYNWYRYVFNEDHGYCRQKKIRNLDGVFEAMIRYFERAPIDCLAMIQTGDTPGGRQASMVDAVRMKRKAMNTLLCSVDRKVEFIGRINEDVTAYALLGSRGKMFLSVNNVQINQGETQKNKGGMTELYASNGTYVKSFYTVMQCPSFVKISMMGTHYRRLHHLIEWNSAVPKILQEKYRKPDLQGEKKGK